MKGSSFQSSWHYVNEVYLDEGPLSQYNFTYPEHNVTEAIQKITEWFQKKPGYNTTYVYEMVMKYGPSGHTRNDSISTAMRLILHYIADIHQPLHAVARVNSMYPKGDMGGNSFPTVYHYTASNLHAVWDSTVYKYHTNPKLPFSDADWETWSQIAREMVDRHPVDTLLDVKDLNPEHWQNDAFKLAVNFVYKGIKENDDPLYMPEYKDQGQIFAERMLVTAGYRMANLLKTLDLRDPFDVLTGYKDSTNFTTISNTTKDYQDDGRSREDLEDADSRNETENKPREAEIKDGHKEEIRKIKSFRDVIEKTSSVSDFFDTLVSNPWVLLVWFEPPEAITNLFNQFTSSFGVLI